MGRTSDEHTSEKTNSWLKQRTRMSGMERMLVKNENMNIIIKLRWLLNILMCWDDVVSSTAGCNSSVPSPSAHLDLTLLWDSICGATLWLRLTKTDSQVPFIDSLCYKIKRQTRKSLNNTNHITAPKYDRTWSLCELVISIDFGFSWGTQSVFVK